MRVELIISSLQDWCLTAMALKALLEPGIEPGHLDWKSSSLPLTYSSINLIIQISKYYTNVQIQKLEYIYLPLHLHITIFNI